MMNSTQLRTSRFLNNTGSSLLETSLLIHFPVIFDFTIILLLNVCFNYELARKWIFLSEFLGYVVPLITLLTIFSDCVYWLFSIYLFIIILFVGITLFHGNISRWCSIIDSHHSQSSRLPCITHFRGIVNLYSAICILGADFECFPKRFLKTTLYGYSLMDTGVGLYVATLGLSSLHFSTKLSCLRSRIDKTIQKALPLFIIGVVRYVITSSIDYRTNALEYGVHWNFFVTLSILILFNEILFHYIYSVEGIFKFSVFLVILYECSLSLGLKDYILGNTPRSSFWSANREGLFSLFGFELIYLWCTIARYYLPQENHSYREYIDVLKVYLYIFPMSWCATIVCQYLVGISRRCANCGYVFWIISITLTVLSVEIVFELIIVVLQGTLGTRIWLSVPEIVTAINNNGLLFFLLANVVTGAINLSIDTLTINYLGGVIIISAYIAFCCFAVFTLHSKNIRIR